MFKVFNLSKNVKRCSRLWTEKCCYSQYPVDNESPPPICGGFHKREPSCSAKKCQVGCAAFGACPAVPAPECGKNQNIRPPGGLMCCMQECLTKDSCDGAVHPHEKKHVDKPETVFKSMWGDLEPVKCTDLPLRHDMEYYHSSDKLKRKYQQTWEDCASIKRRRKICCFDDLPDASPACTEKRKLHVQSAIAEDDGKLKIDYELLKKCMNKSLKKIPKEIPKCLKIKLACCQPVAKSTRCHRHRSHGKCKKECTPYPSFSECQHPPLRKPRPVECKCTKVPEGCIVMEFFQRKVKFNIPPPLPAWPPRPK
uniref:Uncharacterized protein n=1 Tax=Glossina brevipalpis TaxID=37001 RepID=A0A1A9W9M6_9MUSC